MSLDRLSNNYVQNKCNFVANSMKQWTNAYRFAVRGKQP